MTDYLKMLDEIEELRQKACEDPQNYPTDYMNRLCAAIVAEYAGYESRNGWTDELKKYPHSKYKSRLVENRFHV